MRTVKFVFGREAFEARLLDGTRDDNVKDVIRAHWRLSPSDGVELLDDSDLVVVPQQVEDGKTYTVVVHEQPSKERSYSSFVKFSRLTTFPPKHGIPVLR